MKKKVLSLILTVVLVCALATPAMAVTVTEIVPCKYDAVYDYSEGLAAVELNGKWGYIDKTGKEVIPCQYDDTWGFEDGLAAVAIKTSDGDQHGFIDKTGKVVVPFGKYENLTLGFSEGMASVDINGKWGFIDTAGKEVIPGRYDWAEDFREGLAVVVRDDKWGYIDQTGKEVIPCQFSGQALWFSEGLAAVGVGEAWEEGTYGYIDRTGKVVVPCEYDSSWDFCEGMVRVMRGEKVGFADATGKEVVSCKYDDANDFSEGLATVMLNGKCGYIDKTGKEVIPCRYDAADDFSEGLAAVMLNGKCGYIDKTGKEVIPLQYDGVGGFSQGLAGVMLNGKCGYIDKTGKEMIPFRYDGAWDFSEGYAICLKGSQFVFVDTEGNEAVCPYNYVEDVYEGLAIVCMGDPEEDGKWGVISLTASSSESSVPATGIAYPSTQTVDVDGKAIEFQCYALKEGNGMTNYIKLRDLADILNGSAAQFEVGWDGQVTVTTGQGYTKNGSEQKTPFSGNRTYKEATAKTLVDGKAADLAAFTLTDDNGGGYTYYKLRDLGTALGFKVDWTAERGIFIETK